MTRLAVLALLLCGCASAPSPDRLATYRAARRVVDDTHDLLDWSRAAPAVRADVERNTSELLDLTALED